MSSMTTATATTVRISFSIDIDAEAWAEEYGIEENMAAIRRDVKEHVEQTARAHFSALGVLAE